MKNSIIVGDRFRRTDQFRAAKTYSVSTIFEPNGHKLHAILVNDESPQEAITISIPTLEDRRFWERLQK